MPAGRPKVNFEEMPARVPAGTKARIAAVRSEKESQADFLKAAILAELERRERKA